jgi:hypothetical protein
MADAHPVSAAQIQSTRTQVVQALSDHFAADRLSIDELDSRMERAYKARTVTELLALVEDLAPLPPPGAESDETAVARHGTHLPAPPRKNLLALLGGVVRRGSWAVPQRVNAVAICGGIELDLREAQFGPGITEFHIFAMMGGVDIKVPPHVRLEVDGMAIMGGFADRAYAPPNADANTPILRITGFALMGGVDARVKVSKRDPEE